MDSSQAIAQTKMDEPEALIFGFQVDANGAVTELLWDDNLSKKVTESTGLCWLHLNRESEVVQRWLASSGLFDELIISALLQEDTRPRIVKHNKGYLLNLRGVNLNPGQDAEDMITLRLWATANLVISTRARRVLATEDLRDQFIQGKPPKSAGALIAFVTHRLVTRIGPVIAELDDKVDVLEDQLLEGEVGTSKANIGRFRRTVLTLRRYIAPQREAIAGFLRDSDDFLNTDERHQLRDTHDAVARMAEDLDLIRERALLLQEQLVEERAEAMNDRLFVLAIISAIFLPLSFLTGLFGVNVGGMPGVEHPYAFWVVCVAMVLFAIGIVALFKWRKWI